MTLALPKTGLTGSPAVGDLYVADISVPPQLHRHLGIDDVVLFADGETRSLTIWRHLRAAGEVA